MQILEIVNVTKRFGGLKAVDDVSLNIENGGVVGLIGPNGSGKTTLFNTIAGLYKPDFGKIYYSKERIDGLPPNKIFEKGLVRSFQNPRLFPEMTVLENVLVSARDQRGEKARYAPLHWTWRPDEIKHAATAANITSKLNLDGVVTNLSAEISGGQMKLLELGRCLMGNPKLLLLDEPAAGVAVGLAHKIFDEILYLKEKYGMTFLIIEHRLEMLFRYVKEIFVMYRGRIIAHGTPDEIASDQTVVNCYLGGKA